MTPSEKINVIKSYQRRYDYKLFFETGTHFGVTLRAVKNDFEKIVSVEIDKTHYRRAVKNFSAIPHIRLIHGDSGEIINYLLQKYVNQPAIFWIDAHYNDNNPKPPVIKELEAINSHNFSHVVLVDDVRLFGANAYPSIRTCNEIMYNYDNEIINDINCFTRKISR